MCKKCVWFGMYILVLSMTACTAIADITEGLVGHWLLTDGTGATAMDMSGAGNDGAIEGSPVWVSDPVRGGTVLVFDGVDDRINFGPLFTFQNNSWSLSLWFKTPPSDDRIPLVGKNNADGSFNAGERDIEITGNGTWANIIDPEPAGNLAVNAHSLGGAVSNQAVISLDDDTWHLATVVHDNSADATDITFYIDGVVQPNGSQTFNNNNRADVGDFYLGFANASGSGAEGYFTGRMSDLRLYSRALTPEEVVQIMEASLSQEKAGGASPADGSVDVLHAVTLSWNAGKFAEAHDVYLGTTYTEVDEADITASVSPNQAATSFDAGILEFGRTYYWRVDEVNGTPDKTVFKGDVWRFTVEPVSIPIEAITATASSSQAADMGPENTIGGVGLNESDQHSTEGTEMWLSGMGDATPSIQYEFDKPYKLHEMWVWNSNQSIETFIGIGAKDVVIEHSVHGVEWVALGDAHQFAQAPGSATYTANTMVDFGGALAQFVRIKIDAGWGMLPQYGISEVRFYYIPTFARQPQPADGETIEGANVTLTWRAGREAASHEVYLGIDAGDLTLVGTTHENAFEAEGLNYDTTYYWQIIEVNDTENPTAYAGDVWRFSTPAFGVVDSFDQYDDDCQRIFFAWLDGLGHNGGEEIDNCDVAPYTGNGTGSIVGHATAPFAERTTAYAGRQSMPFSYDNAFGQSEATLTLDGQNWTTSGIKTLALAFYGTAGNTGQLYVKINNKRLDYDGDPVDITQARWHAWNIDLASVDGNLQNVTSLSIGVEGANATGTVYIDEIRLYPLAGEVITPVMPDSANLVLYLPLDGNTQDASGNNRHGTASGTPVFVAGAEGQGLLLNGGSDYVNIDGYQGINADRTDPDNPTQKPFTVACWVKTIDNGSLICWGSSDGTGVGGQYQNFRIDGGSLRAEHGNGNWRGATMVNDDEWHHVAMVVAAGANLTPPATQLFVDGQPDSFRASGNQQNIWNLTPDADVGIGVRASHGDRLFIGTIDEVRIYDRALSAAEIAGLAGRTRVIHQPF